jgi:hypothetical protein
MDWTFIVIVIVSIICGGLLVLAYLSSQPDEDFDPIIERSTKAIREIEEEIKRLKK